MPIRRWFGRLWLLLLLAASPPAGAQEQTSSVEGVVIDGTGAVLRDVRIELVGAALVGRETARTDVQGTYRFPSVPSGSYEIRASRQGFAPSVTAFEIGLGELKVVDLKLGIEGVQLAVQVTAPRRPVDVQQSTSGFQFSST